MILFVCCCVLKMHETFLPEDPTTNFTSCSFLLLNMTALRSRIVDIVACHSLPLEVGGFLCSACLLERFPDCFNVFGKLSTYKTQLSNSCTR